MADRDGVAGKPLEQARAGLGRSRTGLSVRCLTFSPHPLAHEAREAIAHFPHLDTDFMKEALSARMAFVRFENGWGVSVVGCIPSSSDFAIVKGDLRVPTYEVAVIDPSGEIEGHPFSYLDEQAIDDLLARVASRTHPD